MPNVKQKSVQDPITPLSINGLQGRMLHIPAQGKRNKEILLVYGHHSSLERMASLAEALSRYGSVTVPDMPGFGNMHSFYKIGKQPTIDNMADYLAAFVKLRYKDRPIVIIGLSLGFAVATRMLQKYPKIADQASLVVSYAGFTHHDDFVFSRRKRKGFYLITRFLSTRPISGFMRIFLLRRAVIRWAYNRFKRVDVQPKAEVAEDRKKRVEFEVDLWQQNDIRTHFFTLSQMFRVDLCMGDKVALPVNHIAVDGDQYFDRHMVEQHMRVIYSHYVDIPLKSHAHAPTVIATAKEAAAFIPRKLITLLNK